MNEATNSKIKEKSVGDEGCRKKEKRKAKEKMERCHKRRADSKQIGRGMNRESRHSRGSSNPLGKMGKVK